MCCRRGSRRTLSASDEEEEFTAQQGIVENARRLLTQLSASTEFVDDSARADVDETVAMTLEFSAAIAQAADEAAAEAALAPLFESSPEGEEEASAWILDTCGVDIDG